MITGDRALTILDAIAARKSVRAFRPDPVPRDVLCQLLDVSRRAPSWANWQPWEVAVVSGKTLDSLKDALAAALEAGVEPNPDVPWPDLKDRYYERRRDNGRAMYRAAGIGRDDIDKKEAFSRAMQRFFEAPVGLIFYTDAALGHWATLDLGFYMQNVMLAAVGLGLSTCPMAMVSRYPDVLRAIVDLPASKTIFCGVALGYADEDAPINRWRSDRVPLEEFVLWRDDEGD